MIYLHRIYFIIVLFTLIFHGRLGFSDNNKLHEAEGTTIKILPLVLSLVCICVCISMICKSKHFFYLWWWWLFGMVWNWEVRALKEIGKKLGKKDWDFNKDPC